MVRKGGIIGRSADNGLPEEEENLISKPLGRGDTLNHHANTIINYPLTFSMGELFSVMCCSIFPGGLLLKI